MTVCIKNKNHQILEFLKYKSRSHSIHSVHPPFAFDFFNNILKKPIPAEKNKLIEDIRKKGYRNRNVIEHSDMGAGAGDKPYIRTYKRVSQLVKETAISPHYGQVLFNLVAHYKPKNVLEFGTSAGISTLYLAAANTGAQIRTMEGCAEVATVAHSNFKKANIDHIEQFTGEFISVLPLALQTMPSIDMVYIDGNHMKQPTLEYFNILLNRANNETIFVFDDIHWSKEMTEAWNTICQNKKVTLSIDLFRMGIIFFKKELSKQHLILRY